MGRHSEFTEELATRICAEISAGSKLSDVCKPDDMPCERAVYGWLAKQPTFVQQYARAMEERTNAMAEELLAIADDGSNDFMQRNYGEDVAWVENGEAIQRSKLRVDTRKWLMSKMNAKKYGDKFAVGGDKAMDPIQTESITAGDLAMALLGKLRPAIEGD
jgi:hypothetical protein